MRGVTFSFSLLADSVDSINDRGLQRGQAKPNGHGGIIGLKQMVRTVSFEGPVLNPYVELLCRRTRLSEGTPADLFPERESLLVFISEGEVGEIEAFQSPF